MAKFPTYEEMGKKVAEKALDEFLYDGKSIREWTQIIASKDAISRKAVLDTLENMDKALDEDRTVENYKDLLRECYKVLPSVTPKPKSEWEHDHEILKAYSDGASAVLDKIRDEIREQSRMHMDGDLYIKTSSCMQIINDYMAEEDKE